MKMKNEEFAAAEVGSLVANSSYFILKVTICKPATKQKENVT
jgi:hypothetical protein